MGFMDVYGKDSYISLYIHINPYHIYIYTWNNGGYKPRNIAEALAACSFSSANWVCPWAIYEANTNFNGT